MVVFREESLEKKLLAINIFNHLLQNEQQKALQATNAYNSGKDFGGTSISSLIRVPILNSQIEPKSYEELADIISDLYIEESGRMLPKLVKGFTDSEVELFKKHGVFYGVHISPKLLALSEGLFVEHKDLIVDGFPDPYNLPNCSREIIEGYFSQLREQRGLDLDLSSIVLADTTTPRGYEGKKILNPSRLNEKLSLLSRNVGNALDSKGCNIDPLYFLSTDTDSPNRVLVTEGKKILSGYPLTPGLTMCGSTSTIEGFDFRYAYRIGLIAQNLGNNIVASKIKGEFNPFTFIGMLSPFGYVNRAIPTGEMGNLRYPGSIDLRKEFEFQYEKSIKPLM